MERMPPELAEQVIFTNEAEQDDDLWRWCPHVFVVEFGLGGTPPPPWFTGDKEIHYNLFNFLKGTILTFTFRKIWGVL